MREIKFRAWYNPNNEMINWIEIQDCIRQIDWDYFMSDCELMQFTGLSDKNGVDIFEGDIGKTFNGEIAIVKYGEYQDDSITDNDGGFYKETIGDPDDERYSVGFYIDTLEEQISIDSRMDLWFEVIGNIHQNPELLEVKS